MVMVMLELDQEVERQARSQGLLTPERLNQLLTAELERQRSEAAWEHVFRSMDIVRTEAASKYAHLSEEEVMDIVNDEIEAMRAEKRTQKTIGSRDGV